MVSSKPFLTLYKLLWGSKNKASFYFNVLQFFLWLSGRRKNRTRPWYGRAGSKLNKLHGHTPSNSATGSIIFSKCAPFHTIIKFFTTRATWEAHQSFYLSSLLTTIPSNKVIWYPSPHTHTKRILEWFAISFSRESS